MAIDRMLRALEEYVIGGIKTNIGLFRRILMDADFRAARIDTGYLERLLAVAPAAVEASAGKEAVSEDVIALAAALFGARAKRGTPAVVVAAESRWARRWTARGPACCDGLAGDGGKKRRVELAETFSGGRLMV